MCCVFARYGGRPWTGGGGSSKWTMLDRGRGGVSKKSVCAKTFVMDHPLQDILAGWSVAYN